MPKRPSSGGICENPSLLPLRQLIRRMELVKDHQCRYSSKEAVDARSEMPTSCTRAYNDRTSSPNASSMDSTEDSLAHSRVEKHIVHWWQPILHQHGRWQTASLETQTNSICCWKRIRTRPVPRFQHDGVGRHKPSSETWFCRLSKFRPRT